MIGISSCRDCHHQVGEVVAHFVCPQDGLIHQDCVDFLCNKCDSRELTFKDGVYLCPQCYTQVNPFRCRLCGSRKISFVSQTTELV